MKKMEKERREEDYEEYDDDMNDETFGVDMNDVKGSEFSFGIVPSAAMPATGGQKKQILTVEELESQMMASKPQPTQQQKVLTVDELEQQFLSSTIAANRNKPELGKQVSATAAVAAAEEEDEYAGLMMDHEKEFVLKVQMSQLSNDPSYLEDFYCRKYRERRPSSVAPTSTEAIARLLSGGKEEVESEEQMVARILSQVRAPSRTKADKQHLVQFEGALGKVSKYSLKNPKKLLEISADSFLVPQTTEETGKNLRLSFRRVLFCIESVLEQLIALESLPMQEGDPATAIQKIWADLHNVTNPGSQQVEANSDILNIPPPDKNLSLYLSVSKGRKSIPRLFKFLSTPQRGLLLSSVFFSLKNIIITSAEPLSVLAELDEYTNCGVYPFLPFIAECPLTFIIDCMSKLLSNSGDLIAIARTKPGLLFLTLFITRAEKLKQDTASGTGDHSNVLVWQQTIFQKLFSTFETRFAALFPPSTIMPSIIGSSAAAIPKPIPVDDTYVWQFMAAVAVGSSLDQQRILVTEARDRIFEVVSTQGQEGTKKANLLLNALGLDASQLAL